MTHLWGRYNGGRWELIDKADGHNFIDFILEQYQEAYGDGWEFVTNMGEHP